MSSLPQPIDSPSTSTSTSPGQTSVSIPEAFGELINVPSRYKAYYGGRGGAKSHAFATALVVMGAQKKLRVLCARETQKSIRDSVKRLLDDKIEQCGLKGFYESTETEIRNPLGTNFIFSGLRHNVDSIKSMEGIDICWVEEAHSLSADSLKKLIPTIRKEGSEIWFSWNPDLPTDPVDAMFRGSSPPPNSIIKMVSWRDNPWFPETLRLELEWDKLSDPEKYEHVWEGSYQSRSESRVFRNWIVEKFEINESDAEIMIPRFGADFGFAIDPSVLVRLFVDEDNRRIFIRDEAYKVGCEIEDHPALFAGTCPDYWPQRKRWDNRYQYPGIPGAMRWPIRADSARPETISYMRGKGFNIHPAKKGPNSVVEGIEWLKNYRIIIHPDCSHTIDEFAHYRYKLDPKTDEVLPILEDKKNHVIDATRYAVETLRRSIGIGGMKKPPMHFGTGKQPNLANPVNG